MAESLFPLYKQTLEKFRTEHDFHEFESEATTINAKIQVGLDRFNEAYRICKSLNRRKRSHNFNIIAKCIKKLKKWKEELEDLSISREKKHEIWDCIGDMYDCDGVFNFKHKAILAYQHSLKYCDDQEKKSDLYLSLAILHEQRCEYPQSLQCFQKGSGLSSDPKLFDIGALRVSLYFNSRKIDANLLKAALNSISDTKLKNKLATITEHDIKEDVIADLKKPNYYPNDVEIPDISDCSSDDEEDTNNATTKFRRKVTKENQYGKLTFLTIKHLLFVFEKPHWGNGLGGKMSSHFYSLYKSNRVFFWTPLSLEPIFIILQKLSDFSLSNSYSFILINKSPPWKKSCNF